MIISASNIFKPLGNTAPCKEEGKKEVFYQHIYLQLYGIRHVVKDHSDNEMIPIAATMDYTFQLAERDLLYALG